MPRAAPMPDLVVCQRCHEPLPTSQLLEHLRLMHPDVDAEPGDTVEDLTGVDHG